MGSLKWYLAALRAQTLEPISHVPTTCYFHFNCKFAHRAIHKMSCVEFIFAIKPWPTIYVPAPE